jgi:hypothetical protein
MSVVIPFHQFSIAYCMGLILTVLYAVLREEVQSHVRGFCHLIYLSVIFWVVIGMLAHSQNPM